MFLGEEFTVDTLPARESFEPLPAGWYDVIISGADYKATKNGSGYYIKLQYTIEGPSYQGRVVFGNLNTRNANPVAEKIGRQQLGELLAAIGLRGVTDTEQLLNHRLSIKLKIRKSDEYGDSNDVAGFRAAAGVPRVAVAAPVAAAASAPAASAPASNTPPWAK